MKRFQFNLEALCHLYGRQEEAAKKNLGEANRLQILAEEEFVRLGKEYDLYQDKETKRRETGETVQEMRLYIQYVFNLKRRIESQREEVKKAVIRVKLCREKLVEAKKRLKAIERIRENRLSAWKKERGKFEMKFLDDVCQQQFVREHLHIETA